MPPQTTKEAVRAVAIQSVKAGLGALQSQTQPSPDQMTSGSPNMSELYHIPGASMHEILYTNGDGAPTPDRTVVPRVACGELYAKEQLSKDHDGTVPENPLRERYDNYGNRWLEGGFEYPPYEGRLTHGETSDDIAPVGNEAEAMAGPVFQANGDERPVVTVQGEQTGLPGAIEGPENGVRSQSGHTGSRSDKWPATGLTNFKHPGA